jgi:AraC-like DNA-binding protein/ligand-binding sensor protein
MQTTFDNNNLTNNRMTFNPGVAAPRYTPVSTDPTPRFQMEEAQPAGPKVAEAERPNGNKHLVEAISNSPVYQEFQRAFTEATGLPVALRPVESWQLPHHGRKNESPFCDMMAQKSRTCAACLQVQQELSDTATHQTQTVTCVYGLSDTAVPVRMGDHLVGYLQTGQIFRKAPSKAQFNRVARQVAAWGLEVDEERMREAYFGTRVLSGKQYDAMISLLQVFAQHLSMVANQVVTQHRNAEPPVITRAKEYIQKHQADELSLAQVAQAVNTSTFYFCKMFKKVTGLNFTDYVSRVRIEKAKNLLLNRNLRISEIAFEVGFQSLTHFNRVFKKISGQSPTVYRDKLPTV